MNFLGVIIVLQRLFIFAIVKIYYIVFFRRKRLYVITERIVKQNGKCTQKRVLLAIMRNILRLRIQGGKMLFTYRTESGR